MEKYLLIETHRDDMQYDGGSQHITSHSNLDDILARVEAERRSYSPQQYRYSYEVFKVECVELELPESAQ
jgi:hypothetical protein